MKNKKTLIFLVPLVLFIWGSVAFKIFYKSKDAGNRYEIRNIAINEDTLTSEKYELMANYKDPFLRNKSQVKIPHELPIKNNQIKPIKINNLQNYPKPPDLKYYGFVLFDTKKTALIEYGGKNMILHERDISDDIQILSITSDTLSIFYHEKKYSYAKIR